VRNYNVILGTNASTSLGFAVTHIDGRVVSPVESVTQEPMFCVTLQQSLRLGPYQIRTKNVVVSESVSTNITQTGVLSPSKNLVKEKLYDFSDRLWDGSTTLNLPLTNWTQDSVVIEKRTVVGRPEEASLVDGKIHCGLTPVVHQGCVE